MKTASAAKVAAQFDDYLDASQQQPVLVTRNGKPVAVLLAVRNKRDAEELAASPRRSLKSIFKEAHEQIDESGGIMHEEFWKRVAQSRAATPKPSTRSRRRG
ncbi:MAG: type II toxin-antitoxin system prevent-host-death family antitoxin [Pirellulales bacterium]